MRVMAVVIHKGALAHYSVHKSGNEEYEAHLLQYGGALENEPPHDLSFIKSGRHCTGSVGDQDLMDDLRNAVVYKMAEGDSPAAA